MNGLWMFLVGFAACALMSWAWRKDDDRKDTMDQKLVLESHDRVIEMSNTISRQASDSMRNASRLAKIAEIELAMSEQKKSFESLRENVDRMDYSIGRMILTLQQSRQTPAVSIRDLQHGEGKPDEPPTRVTPKQTVNPSDNPDGFDDPENEGSPSGPTATRSDEPM